MTLGFVDDRAVPRKCSISLKVGSRGRELGHCLLSFALIFFLFSFMALLVVALVHRLVCVPT